MVGFGKVEKDSQVRVRTRRRGTRLRVMQEQSRIRDMQWIEKAGICFSAQLAFLWR